MSLNVNILTSDHGLHQQPIIHDDNTLKGAGVDVHLQHGYGDEPVPAWSVSRDRQLPTLTYTPEHLVVRNKEK